MGDVVMTTPLLRCLKNQLNAEIHFLTKAAYKDLVRLSTVDQIHLFDNNLLSLVNSLKTTQFDYIIDLHNNLRSRIFTFLLNKPTLRTDKLIFSTWLFLRLGIDRLCKKHIIERHFESVKTLGIKDDGKGMDVPISKTILQDESLPIIAICIGGSYVTKRIPIRLVNELIKARQDVSFYILGGNDVAAAAKEIFNLPNVRKLIGGENIQNTIQIINASDLLITGDTGLMHMGAALQKKMIVIWGSTSDDFGFAPFYGYNNSNQSHFVENKSLPCRPCSKYGREVCPKGHMKCLNEISTNEVLLLTNQLI